MADTAEDQPEPEPRVSQTLQDDTDIVPEPDTESEDANTRLQLLRELALEIQREIAETENAHMNESVPARNGVLMRDILDDAEVLAAGEERRHDEEYRSDVPSTLPPPYELE